MTNRDAWKAGRFVDHYGTEGKLIDSLPRTIADLKRIAKQVPTASPHMDFQPHAPNFTVARTQAEVGGNTPEDWAKFSVRDQLHTRLVDHLVELVARAQTKGANVAVRIYTSYNTKNLACSFNIDHVFLLPDEPLNLGPGHWTIYETSPTNAQRGTGANAQPTEGDLP